MKSHSRLPHSSRAFTLIELLVVLMIIAILASLAIGGMSHARKKANRQKTTGQMEAIKLALEKYHNDYGSYPASSDFTTNPITWGSGADGAQVLYRVISGDFNGDGDVLDAGEEPFYEDATDGAQSKFGFVAEDSGKFFLADGFNAAFNYRTLEDVGGAGNEAQMFNPYTYDLWSWADSDPFATDPVPGTTPAPAGEMVPARWIKNW